MFLEPGGLLRVAGEQADPLDAEVVQDLSPSASVARVDRLPEAEVGVGVEALRRVAEHGAGVAFISYRLDEVIEFADWVLGLRDGKVIADVRRGGYDHDDLVELIGERP